MQTGRACHACEALNGDNALFCSQCGASITANGAAAQTASREERRQITVLFSDASGYTQMAEELDPEVVRELMNQVYELAGAIVGKYGGRIDKLMGDAVLAVFGDPVAHEDDAERAIRAALELHASVDDLRPGFEAQVGRSFAMHSGINSGVVITSALDGDRASGPLGDMVNVAARLQSLAAAGEVFIGPDTRSLVTGRFELTDLGERELKGRRDPVQVTRVDGVASMGQAPSRRSSEFVGRQEELGVLLGAVDRMRDGVSTVITVCAEAGAGKTRLLEEVRASLAADVQWLEGRAYPYTANIPYAPVIDLLNRTAMIDENDTAEQVRLKIEAILTGLLPGDDLALMAVGYLYGLTPADGAVDLEAFRAVLLSALARLLDAAARRAPTVVCLQDLHWVDPSTVDLVRELVSAITEPVVIVCNFRPGFNLGAPGERALQLGELTPRQTRAQLASLLDGADPPDELVTEVTARTDGNPFFVEEIVNSLLETGVLVRAADGWDLNRRLDDITLPATIRGLIAARIDNLDPDRRRVLREVSVVGREFLYELVQSVITTPEHLDLSLADLSAADLIREKATDPDLEYVFKHALTQEVAYDGLLRRDRQSLHERVARALEVQLGDRVSEFVETLAYHYERSGHVIEAVDYLRRAGRKALDRYAMVEAHNHYQAAYALLTTDDPDATPIDPSRRDRLLLETILEWSQAHYYTGEYTKLHHLQTLHHDLPAAVGDDPLSARWLAWLGNVAWIHHNNITGAGRLLDEALVLGERCDDPTAQAYALAWLPWTLWLGGDTARAVTMWPKLSAILPSVPDPYDRRYAHFKGLCGAATASALRGDTGVARSQAEELLDIGARTGNRRASSLGHCVLIAVHYVQGNQENAIDEAAKAIECKADPVYAAYAESWSAALTTFWGDQGEAMRQLDQNRDLPTESGLGTMVATYDLVAALLAMLTGQLSRGMRDLGAERERNTASGNSFLTVISDVFLATLYARIATGEAGGSPTAALRNPSFVLRHIRGAGKRGRGALEHLTTTLDQSGYGGLRPTIEFELGKLAKHEARTEDVRTHVRNILELLAHEPDATFSRDAAVMLTSL